MKILIENMTETMKDKNLEKDRTYCVMGYDKDNDVYEVIAESPQFEHMMITAKAIINYHLNVKEIHRIDNDEPFDFFTLSDGFGNRLWIFSPENPEGIFLRD